jgi:hypothetical protein
MRRRSCLVWFGLARCSSGPASACVALCRQMIRSLRYTPLARHQAPLAFSPIAAVVNTASNRAATVQTRSRAGCASASLRQRSKVSAPMPISRATSSADALSGGSSIRATALFLNACPYLATLVLHRRPRIVVSIGATTILTRGDLLKASPVQGAQSPSTQRWLYPEPLSLRATAHDPPAESVAPRYWSVAGTALDQRLGIAHLPSRPRHARDRNPPATPQSTSSLPMNER